MQNDAEIDWSQVLKEALLVEARARHASLEGLQVKRLGPRGAGVSEYEVNVAFRDLRCAVPVNDILGGNDARALAKFILDTYRI